jgi:hypothetical protein
MMMQKNEQDAWQLRYNNDDDDTAQMAAIQCISIKGSLRCVILIRIRIL